MPAGCLTPRGGFCQKNLSNGADWAVGAEAKNRCRRSPWGLTCQRANRAHRPVLALYALVTFCPEPCRRKMGSGSSIRMERVAARARMGGMKYQEAQDKSVSGVAVLGNEAMQDIIWPKDSPHPFGFSVDGYVPLDAAKFSERDGWKPLHRKRGERPPVVPRLSETPTPPVLARWWEFWKTGA